ncbi:hypothetical protein B0H21DRAFT_698938 [Amylocystis lapponica]|nr:hypothetical protein B0H21DRAFT_698938 [Amylocystis lapponica]
MSSILSKIPRWPRWNINGASSGTYGAQPSGAAGSADLHGLFGNQAVFRIGARRHVKLAILIAFTLNVAAVLWFVGPARDVVADIRVLVGNAERPPLFESYHENEVLLPQHNPDLPFPEGRDGKYLYWPDHIFEVGWNNVMQELMLNALVAYASNRSFVFYNYEWRLDGTKYSTYRGKLIPSQIPITALLSGAIAGQPYYTDPDAPRSVAESYFHKVCPNPKTWDKEEFNSLFDHEGSTETIVSQLVELLANETNCVQIPSMVFDWGVMGSPDRMLDIWPRFSASPILTEFRWSPLIESAFDTNHVFLRPLNASEPLFSTLPPQLPSAARYTPLPGLLALHVRRGDYLQHCVRLADWHSSYTAFNGFPQFPDQLRASVPHDAQGSERRALVRPHCWPTIAEIVQRAEEVRATPEGEGLVDVYVMTNGERGWVRELEAALRATRRWRTITSSRDLLLSYEQKFVAQAVDMLIGQRAQVMIGNGVRLHCFLAPCDRLMVWSSMSGQINLLRMANGFSPNSCRHW